MVVMLLLAVVLAVVCFKLGVYSMLLGLLQLLAKVVFFGTGLFLLVYAGRWLLQRRQLRTVQWGR
jgi:membrane protein implicated in regulation of membrane protease activity